MDCLVVIDAKSVLSQFTRFCVEKNIPGRYSPFQVYCYCVSTCYTASTLTYIGTDVLVELISDVGKRIYIYIHVTGKVTEYYEAANKPQHDKSSECVITYKCHQNVLMERLDLDLNRYFRVDKKNIIKLTLDADCEHVGLG